MKRLIYWFMNEIPAYYAILIVFAGLLMIGVLM